MPTRVQLPAHRALRLAVLLILGPLACAGRDIPSASPPRLSVGDSLPGEILAILEPLAGSYPGVGFAIGRRDEILWAGGLGWSDIDARRPAQADTRFRVYSVIKPLTATAVMSLAADGRLELEAPVSGLLPDLPAELGAVTPRQLAGHLAGIRDYEDGEWMRISRTHCEGVDQALAIFADDPLVHPAGEAYAYSTFGYVLLSAVVAAAVERPFAEVLEQRVLAPAGAHGVVPEPVATDPSIATPYEPARFGGVKPARTVDNSCRFGAGGFVASAADLARFGLALLEGALVDAGTRERMLSSMVTAAGDTTGYGIGWGVGRNDRDWRVASHSGGAIGGRAALYILPDHNVVVALAANIEGESLVDEAARIAEYVAERPGDASEPAGASR